MDEETGLERNGYSERRQSDGEAKTRFFSVCVRLPAVLGKDMYCMCILLEMNPGTSGGKLVECLCFAFNRGGGVEMGVRKERRRKYSGYQRGRFDDD